MEELLKNLIKIESFGLILAISSSLITIAIVKTILPFIRKTLIKKALKTENKLDDILLDNKLLSNVTWFLPVVVLSVVGELVELNSYVGFLNLIINISIPIITISVIFTGLNILNDIYKNKDIYKKIPFFAGIQLLKIITAIIVIIIIISSILGKSPFFIISGLGAATAILMLVFKDVIVGFVSGIHLVTNNMLSKGDWITMPSKGVDGDVIEVGITTVKVRNFDKTITSVPSQQLTNNVFFNWKGMQASGGRRIKRKILIDSNSVHMLSKLELDSLKELALIEQYLCNKEEDIFIHNNEINPKKGNLRALTNIGTFRKYIEIYLSERGDVYTENFTFLIRQLEHNEFGIPIEIYVFTKTTNWIEYEKIQSDIFDHLFSVAGKFDLKIYQRV